MHHPITNVKFLGYPFYYWEIGHHLWNGNKLDETRPPNHLRLPELSVEDLGELVYAWEFPGVVGNAWNGNPRCSIVIGSSCIWDKFIFLATGRPKDCMVKLLDCLINPGYRLGIVTSLQQGLDSHVFVAVRWRERRCGVKRATMKSKRLRVETFWWVGVEMTKSKQLSFIEDVSRIDGGHRRSRGLSRVE
eukprot:Gb_07535 [translate_table: standard]